MIIMRTYVCTYVCTYVHVHMYVAATLRNVTVTSRWNVAVSRLRRGLRNSECHVCVRMALAVGARSRRALPRGSRTAPGRAKGLEENGAGPSGGGGGERGIFKHRGQGQARWAFRAWGPGAGGDGIYRTHTQRAVRERGRRICPHGNDRSKIHA